MLNEELGTMMTIIIADDSPDFRERVRNMVLTHKNIQIVGEPENGLDVLKQVNEKEPDMIILDIRMPHMDGIQVLKRLKAQGSKTIICMLTSYPYPQYKKKCLALGADFFFNKSDGFGKINQAIANVSKDIQLASRV